MLVLSRKLNQSIVIGEDIEILVVDIKGDQIKLGINAPKSVKVFRKEVYEDIERQNKESMLNKAEALKEAGSLLKKGKISKGDR